MSQPAAKPERRRFERVDIPHDSGAHVVDAKGTRQGDLRQLGRGGFLMTTTSATTFGKNTKHRFVILDPQEGLKISVHATFRYFQHGCAGFEFADLDADSAVKVGILIGKYYVSDTTPMHKAAKK